jgi:hypothetical protein
MNLCGTYDEAMESDNINILVVWLIKQEKENLAHTKTI